MERADLSLPPRVYGRAIVWIAFTLTAIGVLMIYSASTFWGAAKFDDPAIFLKRQLVGVGLGIGVFLLCARLPASFWSRRAGFVLLAALLLLALVLVAGSRFNGARRWIRFLGFGFQPSEFAKLAVVVWAAAIAVRKGPALSRFGDGFIPAVLPVVAVCGLTLLEPDFGTCLFLGGLGMLVLILGGLRFTHLLTAGAALLAVVTFFMLTRFEYIRDRFHFFGGAEESYQVRQAYIALGSGGLTGRGIGAGAGKLFFLPEVAGDFIFPSIGEEVGFIGVCVVVALFMAFVWCGYRIARQALHADRFAFLLAMGLTAWVGFQAVVNLAVVSGSAPTKGIALPFISYGSSSLVVCLAASGILLSVSRTAASVSGNPPRAAPGRGASSARSEEDSTLRSRSKTTSNEAMRSASCPARRVAGIGAQRSSDSRNGFARAEVDNEAARDSCSRSEEREP